jgi:hypothetical protein
MNNTGLYNTMTTDQVSAKVFHRGQGPGLNSYGVKNKKKLTHPFYHKHVSRVFWRFTHIHRTVHTDI